MGDKDKTPLPANNSLNSLRNIPKNISVQYQNGNYTFLTKSSGGLFFLILSLGFSFLCIWFLIVQNYDAFFLFIFFAIPLIYATLSAFFNQTKIRLTQKHALQIIEKTLTTTTVYKTPEGQPIDLVVSVSKPISIVSSDGTRKLETPPGQFLRISNTFISGINCPYAFMTWTTENTQWLIELLCEVNRLWFDYDIPPKYQTKDSGFPSLSSADDDRAYDRKKYDDATLDMTNTEENIHPVLRTMISFDDDRYIPVPSEHSALSGRYHNLTKIGDGAQGSMFRALDKNNQPVGIKVYNFLNFQSWKDEELFEREVRTLQSLHFKGIPKYIELIDSNPCYYLIESYIPAPSMAKRIKSGERIDFTSALMVLVNIAEILHYLESLTPPVIHRDIKPDNLLIDDAYNVWLVDFGVVAASNQKTNAMTFAGTAGYMAPEQLMGKVTPAVDIYSTGISILAYLTGKNPTDMKMNDLSVDVKAELSADMPSWFTQLLLDMTEPNPENRITKAASVIAIIRDFTTESSDDHDPDFRYGKRVVERMIIKDDTII